MRLEDGRLGANLGCTDPEGRPAATLQSIIAIDVSTGGFETLFDLTSFGNGLDVGGVLYSLAPGMKEGIASVFGGLCPSMVWLADGRAVPVDIEVGEGSKREPLGRSPVLVGGTDACTASVQAVLPDWSPDGKSIAFLASPSSVGIEGFGRLSQPYELYVMDAVERQPRILVRDIHLPRQLEWSPDSTSLLLSGTLGDRPATVLVRPSDGHLTDVAPVALEWPTWSPDGKQIVGGYRSVLATTEHEGKTEIVILPAPSPSP